MTRIRGAALGREPSRSDIVIIARSDALQSLGIEATVDRLKKAMEAGADVAFCEGMRSREDAEAVISGLAGHPCLVNLVAGGSTPDWTVKEAQALGFKLAIFRASHRRADMTDHAAGAAFSAAALAIQRAYETLKTEGTDKNVANSMCASAKRPIAADCAAPREFFKMVGLDEALELDAKAGNSAYQSGV